MTNKMPRDETAVALTHCASQSGADVAIKTGEILDAALLAPPRGARVLVKPNLLNATPLACTSAAVVAAVCAWLLDHGAHVTVADSPGFGRASAVARAIGLAAALKPLGLEAASFKNSKKIRLPLPETIFHKEIFIPVALEALESDAIFSVARVKAHAQMRLTLCVKNCFGCVPGPRKAFMHTFYGDSHASFAACLAAIWAVLPPVAAVADGITAMHITGPSKGAPFRLGLLGASASAPALDQTIIKILGVNPADIPLCNALAMYELAEKEVYFPRDKPDDFHIEGFITPQNLSPATFHPLRLMKSCVKRMWKAARGC